ncbi:MAG: methylenetetrahydrofolate reductase [Pseudomonadota bacterium]
MPELISPLKLAASVEVTPKQVEKDPAILEMIPPATRTYLVDLGTMSDGEWATLVGKVAQAGLEPVPHIAARRLRSRDALASRLKAMSDAAGVRDALVIAGGAGDPEGPFASSMAALETGLFQDAGLTRIGVAGHPEGSPDIGELEIAQALDWKQTFARESGVDVRIVTQFGFDADAALKWTDNLKAAGITLPIHLGVAGPASIKSLLKYAAMCGVRASSAFAFKRGSAIASLLTSYSPEPFVVPVESHVATNADATVQQLHIFPFGGLSEARRWLVDRGSWDQNARAALAGLAANTTRTSTPAGHKAASNGGAA